MRKFQIKTMVDCALMTLLGCFLVTIISCSGQDPQIISTESYTFNISGNNQSGFADQYLADSIVVSYRGLILNTDSNKSVIPKGITVHFEVISGQGTVDQPDQEIPANGTVYTKWKIGTSNSNHLVRAYVSDKTGKLLNEINFNAYAFQPGRWDVISYLPNGYLNDMVRDTVNKKTFMILGSKLLQEGDKYFKWEKVNSFDSQICHSIEIDKNGTLFVGTWDGKLFKSTDHAKTFTECTKPIPEYSGYYDLTVTSDNKIWVSRYTYPLRYSNDGGITWKLTESGMNINSQAFDIFKLSNGSYVAWMGVSANPSLLKSSDGINWSIAGSLPSSTLKIFVTDNDEIMALNQKAGISAYKSVDYGQTFNRLYSFPVSYVTMPMYNTINKINGYYYVCIPGAGIYKTIDFNSFDQTYVNSDIRGLMIDHNGTFFATNFSYNKVYCFKAD